MKTELQRASLGQPAAMARATVARWFLGCAGSAALLSGWQGQAQVLTGTPPPPSMAYDAKKDGTELAGDDLGRQSLLRRRERPRLFQISSDTQYLYDSNVLLADGDFIQEGKDAVFIQSFGASVTPPLLEPLTSTVFWHHEIVRYDELSKFDFDADTAGLRLTCPVKEWFKLYGGFSASRYAFRHHGEEFYKFYDTRLGLGREQPLTRRALLTYGYQFDWRPSSPARLSRVDNAAYLGLNVALVDRLTAQLFYRLRVRDYLRTDRTDLDHLASLTLAYAFNDYVSVRLSAAYGDNDSTEKKHDYQVFTAGGGLNLSFKF